jgi:hypothetical protein
MPSKTEAQHKMMEIAAHTRGGYGGVPQKVGKDFARADDKAGITKKPSGSPKSRDEHMARLAAHQPRKSVAKEMGVHPSTVSRGVMRAGFKYEGSAADNAADKRGARKAGVSLKEWEGSPADEKQDRKARERLEVK